MPPNPPIASATVELRRGSVYLGAEVYARYFEGLTSVVLLRRGDDLLILPVRHAAGGGYLLKLRNSAGDRVVNAIDFFREQGFEDSDRATVAVTWSTEDAALKAVGAFATTAN